MFTCPKPKRILHKFKRWLESIMAYVQSVIIVLLVNQASIAAAVSGEPTIVHETAAIIGQEHWGKHATKNARMTPVTPLDRSQQRSRARSRAMAKISRCGAQIPPGLKDRCRW